MKNEEIQRATELTENKMRAVIIYIFFFMTLSGFGQPDGSLAYLKIVGSSQDSLVKAFLQIDKNGDGKYILVYKKEINWDTLAFAVDGNLEIQDTCTIRTIQIDQKGLKEVVITWSVQMSHSYGGLGGGFENNYTMNEIWNLDTRKKIFSAQNAYYNWETTVYAENDSADQIIRTVDLAVTDDGRLVISNMKEDNSVIYADNTTNEIKKEKSACSFSPPDHEEGIYIYKDGEFIRIKHKIRNDNKVKKENPPCDAEYENDFSDEFKNACENFYYRFYGILIFYQKTSKTARLLPVFYNYFSESIHMRYFYIDKDYRIVRF